MPPTAPTSKPSGSARDKLRRLKLEAGDYIGCDILKALVYLKDPNVGFNLTQFAVHTRNNHHALWQQAGLVHIYEARTKLIAAQIFEQAASASP